MVKNLLFTTAFSIFIYGASFCQIYDPEGLNMPGTWNGFSNPPTIDALRNPNQSASGDITLITTGQNRYQTKIHCATTGGDVAPGSYNWLFTSGPLVDVNDCNNNGNFSESGTFCNKWAGVNVVFNS